MCGGHASFAGERALYKGSPALAQFYICTDAHTHRHPEGYCYLWEDGGLSKPRKA